MNDGGPGASYATHVRFISLPLLMKTSLLPRISARETRIKDERDRKTTTTFMLMDNAEKIEINFPHLSLSHYYLVDLLEWKGSIKMLN